MGAVSVLRHLHGDDTRQHKQARASSIDVGDNFTVQKIQPHAGGQH